MTAAFKPKFQCLECGLLNLANYSNMSNIEGYISLIAKLWKLTFYAAGHSTNKKCPIRQPYTSTKMSSSKKWHFTLNTKLQFYGVFKLGLTLTNFCWYMLLSTKPVHERFDLYIIVIQPLTTNVEKKINNNNINRKFHSNSPSTFYKLTSIFLHESVMHFYLTSQYYCLRKK